MPGPCPMSRSTRHNGDSPFSGHGSSPCDPLSQVPKKLDRGPEAIDVARKMARRKPEDARAQANYGSTAYGLRQVSRGAHLLQPRSRPSAEQKGSRRQVRPRGGRAGNGSLVHWLELGGEVRELYDVQVIPGVRCPRRGRSAEQGHLGRRHPRGRRALRAPHRRAARSWILHGVERDLRNTWDTLATPRGWERAWISRASSNPTCCWSSSSR
jgi:hypothetical protein